MQFKLPKNDQYIIWTKHAVSKMRQYRLSESRLRHLIKHYERQEQGIAPGTIAICIKAGSKKHPTEIWLMYQIVGKKIKIITAWRYPSISPKRNGAPVPEHIIRELKSNKI